MARGSESGSRGGSRASSESVSVRAKMEAKSPIKGLGKMIRAKRSILDAKGNYKGEEDVEPTQVLIDMAGKSVEEAEKVMANADIEYAALYIDGKQAMLKTSSDPSFVDFNAKETKAMKGGTFTHNHPPGEDGTPIPFSRGDVSMLLNNKLSTFRAVSGNTVFEMSPPKDSKFWKTKPAALKKALNSTFDQFKAAYGYDPGEAVSTRDLARILDDTLKTIDQKMSIGYKKSTLR